MCRHLVTAGHDVLAYDVMPDALAAAEAAGARPVRGLEEFHGVEVVLVVVGFEPEVREVVECLAGLVGVLAPDACVVVGATVPGRLMRELEECLDGALHLVDAPVVRGEHAAEAGTLAAYVGGSDEALALVAPVLGAFCSDIVHVGALGAGQVAKALNNYLLWACICADDEALRLGAAYGLDAGALRRALLLGSGANAVLADWDRDRTMPWAEKDMTIVLEMADESALFLPGAGLVKENIKQVKLLRGLIGGPGHRSTHQVDAPSTSHDGSRAERNGDDKQ
jgi:3-hydroxyisobutyrate dehydrogenase-like beta-hydroxyacid dehydrogenase